MGGTLFMPVKKKAVVSTVFFFFFARITPAHPFFKFDKM